MKTISIILAYQFGACTKEEKCVKTALPAMDNLSKVNGETMVLIGILLAMLTEVFGDHSTYESYQGVFLTIKIACDSRIYTLYDKDCLIPCTGCEHLLWLNKMHDEVRTPLRNVLLNIALKPSEGTRL